MIFDNFAGADRHSKWNLTGLHMLSVVGLRVPSALLVRYCVQVLANELSPFNAADPDLNGLDPVKFYTTLIGCLQAKGAEMYRTAAVVVGMCLQYLAAAGDQTELLVRLPVPRRGSNVRRRAT